jgi:hypothetical protein
MTTPEYVAEFRRWRDAPAAEKDHIALETVIRGVNVPIHNPGGNALEAMTPAGKRLGDCTSKDLEELSAWERALAKMHEARAALIQQQLNELDKR